MTHKERKKTIKQKGLTHEKIAKKINYSRAHVSLALKEPQEGRYRIQAAIADVVGVNYDEFWNSSPLEQRDF